ncbi:hypothetical protein [Sphingopyxis sp. BE235]|uniref:hypothetical protein n=2 Tax=Sphingopyxis TaxID=165697 RepID=UPI00285B4A57|nr:hypothetical protein [Sphingopyxis sp. BE235]MDR7060645.1 hypothetical protein [Sphingopyxis sp. BE235]MDR7181102.1 hypothetical protein [Sphingopyxis sp. BE249]
MMARRADARRDAPALRFLLLCVGGWIAVRIMVVWNPAIAPPPDPATVPWAVPSPFAASDSVRDSAPRADASPMRATPSLRARAAHAFAVPGPRSVDVSLTPGEEPVSGGFGADRHSLRLALFARLLPAPPGRFAQSAAAANGPLWFPLAPAAPADPGQGKPFWIQRQMGGWALAGWLYLREGSGNAPETIGGASQLGGSQAGLRLAYGFGDTGRIRAYGRATIAVQRPQQRELAFGLAFAPLAQLPVDLAIEQRVAAGKEGRTALAAMASGGVSDVVLPAGFRLDAYAQAGVVGTRRRDGFADGAIVVDRRLGSEETSLRLGALAAGAVQPGAARVDVGPRLTLRLPDVGEGSRIALDWRQRVAGDAHPESGLALTLASDF